MPRLRTLQLACVMTVVSTAAFAADWVSIGTTNSPTRGDTTTYWDRQATKAARGHSITTAIRSLYDRTQKATNGISYNEEIVDLTLDCGTRAATVRNRRLLL